MILYTTKKKINPKYSTRDTLFCVGKYSIHTSVCLSIYYILLYSYIYFLFIPNDAGELKQLKMKKKK